MYYKVYKSSSPFASTKPESNLRFLKRSETSDVNSLPLVFRKCSFLAQKTLSKQIFFRFWVRLHIPEVTALASRVTGRISSRGLSLGVLSRISSLASLPIEAGGFVSPESETKRYTSSWDALGDSKGWPNIGFWADTYVDQKLRSSNLIVVKIQDPRWTQETLPLIPGNKRTM